MKFSLIICTYMRPAALQTLLESVARQSCFPDETLIIDGSTNDATSRMLENNSFAGVRYFLVPDAHRGLTRQRNYGIARTSDVEVICFLDDDTVLEKNYFQQLMSTYHQYPQALGVGGYIFNEANWEESADCEPDYFCYDGWRRPDGSRFRIRKFLGLDSDVPPGWMPKFSHGRSIGFLPPSGKVYQVQQLMGGVSSFRKSVFETFSFSEYFEGYGLYEDADFTLRVSAVGPLYVNTAARLAHYHDASGRPDQFRYGKMVVRNGWYVWRVKHPKPSARSIAKWHLITWLLTMIRFVNVLSTKKRMQSLTEALGRSAGWVSLFYNPPK